MKTEIFPKFDNTFNSLKTIVQIVFDLLDESYFIEKEILGDILSKKNCIKETNYIELKEINRKAYYGFHFPEYQSIGDLWFDLSNFSVFIYQYILEIDQYYWIATKPIRGINLRDYNYKPDEMVIFNTYSDVEKTRLFYIYDIASHEEYYNLLASKNVLLNIVDIGYYLEWTHGQYAFDSTKGMIVGGEDILKKYPTDDDGFYLLDENTYSNNFTARMAKRYIVSNKAIYDSYKIIEDMDILAKYLSKNMNL